MADAALRLLLEKTRQLLLHKAAPIGNAKDHIAGLHEDLIRFKAFLRSSEYQRYIKKVQESILNDFTSTVHKAQYSIDKFVVKISIFKDKNILSKSVNAIDNLLTIRRVIEEIKSIRKTLKEFIKRNQFHFDALQLVELSKKRVVTNRKSSPVVDNDYVIGRDEDAETLIKRLNGEDLDLDIITIIGMPGLGKTTLARKIYNDQAIESEFLTRVWVYVSQKYSRREVFLSIFTSIPGETIDYMDSDEVLVKKLRNILEKRKYLIVMDDVWTIDAWKDLKNVFPNNNKGSRVLITSRSFEVASYANPKKKPHNLKFLTTIESWELLERKVFVKEKCTRGELEQHGYKIARECKGLPLAIEVIADILLTDRESRDWWEQVAENVNLFIVTDQTQFTRVRELSYNQLPQHLKSCFLYLGVFPEDYKIPVWKLIRLWIAEGFIEQDNKMSLEDSAEACLEELVNNNLLIAESRDFNGRIKTCSVQKTLHYFCKEEAQEQNFYHEINEFNHVTLDECHRISIHSDVEGYIYSKPSGQRVRSFLYFSRDEVTLQRESSWIPKAFKLLRVLEIRSIIFETFPDDLLQLVLLSYLSISCNIKALPSSISKLWNMQTLILSTQSSTLELKKDMWKMYQLRHLRTNASAILPRPPSNASKGSENVQSLSMISPECCTNHVFARTPKIRKLGVQGNLVVLFEKLFDNVAELKHLTNLKLFNDFSSLSSSQPKIQRLHLPDKFPIKLEKLTLSNTLLVWEQMHILGNLETLEVLKLKNNAVKGKIWITKDGGFRTLKFLHIGNTDLMTWISSKHHFPSLKRLELRLCKKLQAVPYGFSDVDSFQELDLYDTNRTAVASARIIQQKKMEKVVKVNKSSGAFMLSVNPPDMF